MTTARERLWWTMNGSRPPARLAIALSVLAGVALPCSAQDMVVSDLSLAVELQKPAVPAGEQARVNAARDVATQLLKTLHVHRDERGGLGPSFAELVHAVTKPDPAK